MSRRQYEFPKRFCNIGDWVKVPASSHAVGFSEFVGEVVYMNDYFFVVKSGVGEFCESYLWIDASMTPQLFKKITEEEAYCFIDERLKTKMWS